jgi:hypothetical protein
MILVVVHKLEILSRAGECGWVRRFDMNKVDADQNRIRLWIITAFGKLGRPLEELMLGY